MKKSPSDQAAAVLLHLVKKGSLTKYKATGRLEVNGNSKSKVVKSDIYKNITTPQIKINRSALTVKQVI